MSTRSQRPSNRADTSSRIPHLTAPINQVGWMPPSRSNTPTQSVTTIGARRVDQLPRSRLSNFVSTSPPTTPLPPSPPLPAVRIISDVSRQVGPPPTLARMPPWIGVNTSNASSGSRGAASSLPIATSKARSIRPVSTSSIPVAPKTLPTTTTHGNDQIPPVCPTKDQKQAPEAYYTTSLQIDVGKLLVVSKEVPETAPESLPPTKSSSSERSFPKFLPFHLNPNAWLSAGSSNSEKIPSLRISKPRLEKMQDIFDTMSKELQLDIERARLGQPLSSRKRLQKETSALNGIDQEQPSQETIPLTILNKVDQCRQDRVQVQEQQDEIKEEKAKIGDCFISTKAQNLNAATILNGQMKNKGMTEEKSEAQRCVYTPGIPTFQVRGAKGSSPKYSFKFGDENGATSAPPSEADIDKSKDQCDRASFMPSEANIEGPFLNREDSAHEDQKISESVPGVEDELKSGDAQQSLESTERNPRFVQFNTLVQNYKDELNSSGLGQAMQGELPRKLWEIPASTLSSGYAIEIGDNIVLDESEDLNSCSSPGTCGDSLPSSDASECGSQRNNAAPGSDIPELENIQTRQIVNYWEDDLVAVEPTITYYVDDNALETEVYMEQPTAPVEQALLESEDLQRGPIGGIESPSPEHPCSGVHEDYPKDEDKPDAPSELEAETGILCHSPTHEQTEIPVEPLSNHQPIPASSLEEYGNGQEASRSLPEDTSSKDIVMDSLLNPQTTPITPLRNLENDQNEPSHFPEDGGCNHIAIIPDNSKKFTNYNRAVKHVDKVLSFEGVGIKCFGEAILYPQNRREALEIVRQALRTKSVPKEWQWVIFVETLDGKEGCLDDSALEVLGKAFLFVVKIRALGWNILRDNVTNMAFESQLYSPFMIRLDCVLLHKEPGIEALTKYHYFSTLPEEGRSVYISLSYEGAIFFRVQSGRSKLLVTFGHPGTWSAPRHRALASLTEYYLVLLPRNEGVNGQVNQISSSLTARDLTSRIGGIVLRDSLSLRFTSIDRLGSLSLLYITKPVHCELLQRLALFWNSSHGAINCQGDWSKYPRTYISLASLLEKSPHLRSGNLYPFQRVYLLRDSRLLAFLFIYCLDLAPHFPPPKVVASIKRPRRFQPVLKLAATRYGGAVIRLLPATRRMKSGSVDSAAQVTTPHGIVKSGTMDSDDVLNHLRCRKVGTVQVEVIVQRIVNAIQLCAKKLRILTTFGACLERYLLNRAFNGPYKVNRNVHVFSTNVLSSEQSAYGADLAVLEEQGKLRYVYLPLLLPVVRTYTKFHPYRPQNCLIVQYYASLEWVFLGVFAEEIRASRLEVVKGLATAKRRGDQRTGDVENWQIQLSSWQYHLRREVFGRVFNVFHQWMTKPLRENTRGRPMFKYQ
ncbi:uncharacterized protein BDR25DRAFT_358307 [Lindgomyces ingoldianus]|uniref:Uncharacterized protein n=1 Tax=Lindgomyces ingoldianus TaxID=673940 RepID=A0ACB6QL50_9PLEO|nr:uncharacterized protein BDR25DRAFT_358307 [Lindgomyces ingoldianus]KAF2467621.1 hypothetical protein BDR25DRAFT_358307 [Lindgomyces ingoldianus]